MSRLIWFLLCAILGLAMVGLGLLLPAHLRAVETSVLEQAGRNTPTVVEHGLKMVRDKNLGAARLLLETAQSKELPERDTLASAVDELTAQQPDLILWGHDEPGLKILFGRDRLPPASKSEPFTAFIVRQDNRRRALDLLRATPNLVVQELLHFHAQTNTVLFSPAESASGQALDAAVAIGGLLLERGQLSVGLSNALLVLAAEAISRRDSQPLEQVLLDLMSLGQRLDWGQLVAFIGRIDDPETLRRLAGLARQDLDLSVLFAAVQLCQRPSAVADYLMNFSQTGPRDLGESLRYNAGGLNELLRRNARLLDTGLGRSLASDSMLGRGYAAVAAYSLRAPRLALTLKWLLYLGGGFLLAMAVRAVRRVPALEQPLQVRGFHFVRALLFALGFLLVVVLLSEPFLAQDSQKVEFPLRLRLPTVGSAVPAETSVAHTSFMNQLSLLTLLLFFVIQSLIYTACLIKLAEIRRQTVPARIKLKLLENEDHLFDAGLYLGFVGTIISLILVSLGVIKPSLMAAYSSTSFGIIFVSIFRIFNLRPLRRKLVLEAEAIYPDPAVATTAPIRLSGPTLS